VTACAIVQASAVSYQLSRHDRRPRSEKTSVELEGARRTVLRVPQHSYTSGRQENSGTHLPYLRRRRSAGRITFASRAARHAPASGQAAADYPGSTTNMRIFKERTSRTLPV